MPQIIHYPPYNSHTMVVFVVCTRKILGQEASSNSVYTTFLALMKYFIKCDLIYFAHHIYS